MPKYEVTTSRGKFEVDLDREPTSDAELEAAVLAQLSQMREPGETAQAFVETAAPLVGSVVGGAVGGAATRTPAGAIAGSGLGAAAGQQLAEVTRPLLTGEQAPLAESLTRTATTGLLGALGEGAGQAAVRVVGKVLAPFAGKLSREGVKAEGALARAGVEDVMTPGQLTESRGLDILENITQASLLGGGRIQAARERLIKEGIPALVDDVLTQVGSTKPPTEVAQLFAQSRAAAVEVFKSARHALYGEVDRLARGVIVDTKPVLTFIRESLARQSRTVERALGAADIGMDDLTIAIAGDSGRAPETTFRIAQEIRSKLLTVARRKPLSVDDQAIVNVAGKLAGLVDDQMEAAAVRMAPEALTAFRAANAFNKVGVERLENELIRSLAKRAAKQPSTIVPLLAAPNKADVLRVVKAAVDTPTWEQFQGALTTHIVQRAADAKTGIVSGGALLRSIKALGDETAQLVFKDRSAVEQLGRTIEFLGRKTAQEGTGRIFIQLRQAGAGAELVAHPMRALVGGAAAATIVVPLQLGRLFTNPTAVRWLTRGIQAGPGTTAFFNAVSKAVALSEPSRAVAGEAVQITGERLRQLQEAMR